MNHVMKRIVLALFVLTPSLGSADKIWNAGRGATWDCKKDPVAIINAGKGTYTFKGACTSIRVNGGNNKVNAESVDELSITGSRNAVTVGTLGSASVTGSKNSLTWTAAKTGDAPAVSVVGKDNMVTGPTAAAEAPASPPATAAPPATTAAPVSGATIDCTKNPTSSYADNDGTVTFTGKCDNVAIGGNDNRVKIESATAVLVTGNDNHVEIGAADAIKAIGNDNTITYRKAKTANAKTKISNLGNDNKITRVQ